MSSHQPLGVARPPADRPAALTRAFREYTDELHWTVVVRPPAVELRLQATMRAVAVRAGVGCEVASLLWAAAPLGPVVAVPCGTLVLWAFLAADDPGDPYPVVPFGAKLLSRDRTLPLPPTRSRHGEVRWVSRPAADAPRLPRLSLLLAAIRATQRPRRW
ncbi:hypothetical protein AB0A74_01120 [Saccharothrix sp. NPDC042600]|uniref:hypothetical protein n=1 Tax=Saccharothrix TaxID=2071 RepID=UPI00340172E9